jgi:hypothetical protein
LYAWSRHNVLFSTFITNHFLYTHALNLVLQGFPKCFEPTQISKVVVFIFLTSNTVTTLSLLLLRCGLSTVPYLFHIDPRVLIPGSHTSRRPWNPKRHLFLGPSVLMAVGFCLVSDSHDGLSLLRFMKVTDALGSLGVRFSNSISIKKQRTKIQFYYAMYKLYNHKRAKIIIYKYI